MLRRRAFRIKAGSLKHTIKNCILNQACYMTQYSADKQKEVMQNRITSSAQRRQIDRA